MKRNVAIKISWPKIKSDVKTSIPTNSKRANFRKLANPKLMNKFQSFQCFPKSATVIQARPYASKCMRMPPKRWQRWYSNSEWKDVWPSKNPWPKVRSDVKTSIPTDSKRAKIFRNWRIEPLTCWRAVQPLAWESNRVPTNRNADVLTSCRAAGLRIEPLTCWRAVELLAWEPNRWRADESKCWRADVLSSR